MSKLASDRSQLSCASIDKRTLRFAQSRSAAGAHMGPQGPHMGPMGPQGPHAPRFFFGALWGPKGPIRGVGGTRGASLSLGAARMQLRGEFCHFGSKTRSGIPARGLESGCLDSQRGSGLTSGVWTDNGCLDWGRMSGLTSGVWTDIGCL